MNRKSEQIHKLTLAVKIMAAISVLAFVYVMLASAFGLPEFRQSGSSFLTIENNQTVLRNIQGKRVWVTKLASELLAKRNSTNQLIHNENSGCDISKAFCLIDAATTRSGIEIRYVEQKPPQLREAIFWIGGYVNPLNGAVYDRFGRGYKVNSPTVAEQLVMVDMDFPLRSPENIRPLEL